MAPAHVLAVMGVTGAGKSSFLRLVTGNPNIKVGHSMEGETMTINKYEITIRDRDFILVDTPGFDDTYLGDSDVLKMLVKWLESTYRAGTKLSGIMYLHRITDARMQGSALRNLKMFKQLCGEGYFKNLTLGTTCWSLVDPQEATSREKELEENNNFWKPMISRGARMVRIPDDVTEARNLVYKITNHKATALQIQREVVDQKTNFDNLSATKALDSELEKLRKKHEAEKKRLAEENRRRLERVAREQREQQRRRAAIEARNRRIEFYLENTRNCAEKEPFGKCDRCKSSLDKWKVNWHCCSCLPDDNYWHCGPCGDDCGNDEHPSMSRIDTDDCVVM